MFSTILPRKLSSTLPIALEHTHSLLDFTLWIKLSRCSREHDRVRTHEHLRVALQYTPNCTRWHTPSLHDCTLSRKLSRRSQAHSRGCSPKHSQLHSMTLPAYLTIRSQVSSEDTLDYKPDPAPKYTLLRQVPPNFIWLYAPIYALRCSIPRLPELEAPGTGRWLGGGRWREAGGTGRVAVPEIMTLVDIMVWTSLSAQPPRQNFTMPHCHCVYNWSLSFCRTGRQLDGGESRYPTQIVQWDLLLASHRLRGYVCAFRADSDDGDGDDGDDDGVGDGDHSSRST